MACGAAVVLAMPGFSPDADASTPPAIVKNDQIETRAISKVCTQQAWPYYGTDCLRDGNHPTGQVRTIRVVTTDRVAK